MLRSKFASDRRGLTFFRQEIVLHQIACIFLFASIPSSDAQMCADNCNTCQQNGAGQCDRCDLGYGLTPANTCAPCATYCNNTIGCNAAGTCIQCNTGYGLTTNYTCASITTTSAQQSSTSSPGLISATTPTTRNPLNNLFLRVPLDSYPRYDNLSGVLPNVTDGITFKVVECDANCDSTDCIYAGSCTKCKWGFGLNTSNICVACDPNCDNSRNCPAPETCSKYTTTTDSNPAWALELGLIIGLPCAVVILLLLICVFVLCVKYRKIKKQLKRCKTSVEMKKSNTTNVSHQQTANVPSDTKQDRHYQALEDDSSERPYQPIEYYDTLQSSSRGTIYSPNPYDFASPVSATMNGAFVRS